MFIHSPTHPSCPFILVSIHPSAIYSSIQAVTHSFQPPIHQSYPFIYCSLWVYQAYSPTIGPSQLLRGVANPSIIPTSHPHIQLPFHLPLPYLHLLSTKHPPDTVSYHFFLLSFFMQLKKCIYLLTVWHVGILVP